MKKSTIGVIIVVIIVIAGGAAWWAMSGNKGTTTTDQTAAPNSETKDLTDSKTVAIAIHDLSYNPPAIKIKKGTTVTWTNQDSVGHNVVADDAPDTGGIPTSYDLYGRGQSQTVTFVRVGTFKYHCSAHTFMHGSVQVVD